MDNVTRAEFDQLRKDIEDIKTNHLECIWSAITQLADSVRNLRWFIMGSMGMLALVIALVELLG